MAFTLKVRSVVAVLVLCLRLELSLCRRHNTFWSNSERHFGVYNQHHHHQLHLSSSSDRCMLLRAGETNFSTWSDLIEQPLDDSKLSFPMTKQGDGSQDDPDGIPTRYLIAHKQNRDKALAAFQHTCEWRKEQDIDTLLNRPQPNFDVCREIFPVFLPGKDSEGHLIIIQRPGMVDLQKAHDHNITNDEILMHYLYLVEYAWNLLDPSPLPPDGLMTTILDCQGVRFGMFHDKEFRIFGKKLVKIMSDHYPTRSYKTLIVHAPKWIKMAFNLVKPLMRESTRKKIKILNTGPEQDRILKELLGGDNVPSYLLSENHTNEEVKEEPSEIERELQLAASVGLVGNKNAETATLG
jgi:hypothetical protein